MSAVARCFPGKGRGGGDRKPDPEEIAGCRTHFERKVEIFRAGLSPGRPPAIEPVSALGGVAESSDNPRALTLGLPFLLLLPGGA